MSASLSTRSRATAAHPTRQQLDELDALLKRMLELPVNQIDEELAAAREAARPPRPPAPPLPTPGPVSEGDRAAPPGPANGPDFAPRVVSGPDTTEPGPAVAGTDEGGWVPLRSNWRPSSQTWGPLAESWQRARQELARPEGGAPAAEAAAPQPPAAPTEPAPPPTVDDRPWAEGAAAVEPGELPATVAGYLKTAPGPSEPEADAGPPPPWWCWPLLLLNGAFDLLLLPLGPLGAWLRGRGGRNVLAAVGLLCLAAAAALAAGDWFGWTW
jgi:hypothetical protein